ncbi:MAG TPA: hypothetical protein VK912_06570 [Longimicrobiales bacterium]|nr:hypothetical protein [Longimicrobiales bacterium]
MMTSSPLCRRVAVAATALLAAACSSPEDVLSFDPLNFQERTGIVFVRQNATPTAVMEALFEGRVVADAAGCLRFDSPDPATVVWPNGFTMVQSGDEMVVRDATGREIGRVGGTFRLGGGEVTSLQGAAMSAADRQRAQTHCPGRYWIVGDVP